MTFTQMKQQIYSPVRMRYLPSSETMLCSLCRNCTMMWHMLVRKQCAQVCHRMCSSMHELTTDSTGAYVGCSTQGVAEPARRLPLADLR